MEFRALLSLVGGEPIFETALLLAGPAKPAIVQKQLVNWVRQGSISQLRRGLYCLAPPYQKTKPHPFLVANRLVRGSYVSLHSALAHYGLIPEYVAVVTSVGGGRPGRWRTPLGEFEARHVRPDLLWGYDLVAVAPDQNAFLARPEKALLDLVYLQPGGDDPAYLQELRLQNLAQLDLNRLTEDAGRSRSPKLKRAAQTIATLAAAETYETL